MEQSYEITEDGKAKTLNPLTSDHSCSCEDLCSGVTIINPYCKTIWQQAEQQRATYEIEGRNSEEFENYNDFQDYLDKLTPGTIVQGQIINGKLRIL